MKIEIEKGYHNMFKEGALSSTFIGQSIAKHQNKQNIGAHSIFLGQVRADIIGNKKVAAIDYSSYKDLALKKMYEIREAIFKKHTLTCMHVYHSLGKVAAGEICLFVFTSSPNRKAAIEACNELVELLKTDLPIWGKEVFEDHSYQWKENK